jgi:putative hemolysin
MSKLPYDPDKIQVRLASSPKEIHRAQSIRYKVFYEEYGATPNEEMLREKRDIDSYDSVTDHLIVVDNDLPEDKKIVGTYRLLRREVAEKHGQFYTSDEYNIQPLLDFGQDILELGRSCVLADYRTRPILQKLWEGIAHYVVDHNISLMFGCASFHGTDIEPLKDQLSYLYHYHLAPPELCPRTKDEYFVDMNIVEKDELDVKAAFISMPPLLKGYIRLGAYIGDGAYIDEQFNTTDVCIVMPTSLVREKYVKHYERKTQKSIPVGEKISETL